MASITDWEFATITSADVPCKITGSICRIYALSTLTLTDYTLGKYMGNDDRLQKSPNIPTSFGLLDINIQQSSSLDGPFIAVNISEGQAIIYHNGTLK